MARSGRRNTRKMLLWLVVVMAFVGYIFWALREEEPFRVTHTRLEKSDQGISLIGELSNSAAAVPAINVEVTFYNRQGREVGKEIIALDNVAAGATVVFRTPPRRLTDMQRYTIYVNTGRNPYGN